MTTPHPRVVASLILALGSVLALQGCGFWQGIAAETAREDCRKQPTWADQRACRQRIEATFKDYDKKRDALAAGDSERKLESRGKADLCIRREATGERVCPN